MINAYFAIRVMRLLGWQTLVGLILTIVSAFAVDVRSAPPGTLTYIAGEAWIGSQSLDGKAAGTILLKPGQQLRTRNGAVEVTLAPIIFMRLAKNSSANLISLNTTTVEIKLTQGQAIVEIGGSPKSLSVCLLEQDVHAQLLRKSLYEFDADRVQFRVFKGKAFVQEGSQRVLVASGRQFALTSADQLSISMFNKKEFKHADLYRFSSMRSKALAEADARHWEPYYWPGWHGSGRRTF
jgi:hypothetical protein